MRILCAQLSSRIGDFVSNAEKLENTFDKAVKENCTLILTPELSLCGYPPLDWPHYLGWYQAQEAAFDRLLAYSRRYPGIALAVGKLTERPLKSFGARFFNSVCVLSEGQLIFEQSKRLLPTYDLFDETRHCSPGEEPEAMFCWAGEKIRLGICEDWWGQGLEIQEKRRYAGLPFSVKGATLAVSLSASPFHSGKFQERVSIHAAIAKEFSIPFVYLNSVGAVDEMIFDGGSFVLNRAGELQAKLPSMAEHCTVVDLQGPKNLALSESEDRILADALVFGIQEFFARSGKSKAILGLSGGIDSAVAATLLVKALGAENVLGISMPSIYSSGHSIEDASELAKQLKIGFEVRPIKFFQNQMVREWGMGGNPVQGLAEENLQARIRGLLLMTLSNQTGALVVSTGNKSEIAVGYSTLYGDSCGALTPLGDLYKTQVYRLGRTLQQEYGFRIPERTFAKAPSAELRPDQKDQDSLPLYEELDAFLLNWIELGRPISELEGRFSWAKKIAAQVTSQEFKRKQMAPILRVSKKSFGLGRRIPVVSAGFGA